MQIRIMYELPRTTIQRYVIMGGPTVVVTRAAQREEEEFEQQMDAQMDLKHGSGNQQQEDGKETIVIPIY